MCEIPAKSLAMAGTVSAMHAILRAILEMARAMRAMARAMPAMRAILHAIPAMRAMLCAMPQWPQCPMQCTPILGVLTHSDLFCGRLPLFHRRLIGGDGRPPAILWFLRHSRILLGNLRYQV